MKKASVIPSRECANCGALENPPGSTFSACARCHLVFYCSRACQVQHWKQKPTGHKQFCVTHEERRPPPRLEHCTSQARDELSRPARAGATAYADEEVDECAICLDPLVAFSSTTCTLPCSHVFHAPCVARLRSFGISEVCPLCRAELPPGPEQLFEEACRLYVPLQKLVVGSDGSWGALTKKQQRTMDEVIRLWKGAADQGDVRAQSNLGSIYLNGQGVSQN